MFIPAITSYHVIKGDNKSAGTVRMVKTSDGGEVEETLVTLDRPNLFVYTTKGFHSPFNLIVKSARGEFRHTPYKNGTEQEWTYSYELTSFLAYPLAAVVLGIFLRKAMEIAKLA